MLRKPGDVDRSSFTAVTSRVGRKTNETNPDDEIRKLQKQPCNKKCADCSAKVCHLFTTMYGMTARIGLIFNLPIHVSIHRTFVQLPQAVNLTHGSFVCLVCAGIQYVSLFESVQTLQFLLRL